MNFSAASGGGARIVLDDCLVRAGADRGCAFPFGRPS